MTEFRNIRPPGLVYRKFDCSPGFSSKYFNVIQVVGNRKSFKPKQSLVQNTAKTSKSIIKKKQIRTPKKHSRK